MPTEVLAAARTAANSVDIVVAANTIVNVGIFMGANDHLLLPGGGFSFLLPGGGFLLLPAGSEVGDPIPAEVQLPIKRKDPNGHYNPTNMILRGSDPDFPLHAGTYQIQRPVLDVDVGVQKD